MRILQGITTFLFLYIFYSCNSSQNHNLKESKTNSINIQDRIIQPETPISALLDSLRPSIQTFKIKGDRDTLLVGQNGTVFVINKNTFTNAQQQFAKTIDLTLVEVNTIADMVKANLQTTSDDKILTTGGMFFIDAKNNDSSLAIAEGKSIYVEVKTNNKNPEMKIFKGNFDNKAKINWTLISDLENKLIPIPLSLINFHRCDFECGISKKETEALLNPKYENTFIATREFEDRCCALMVANCDWFNGLSQRIIDIYTSNLNMPLYHSDSLVVDYFLKNNRKYIDTTKKMDWDTIGWTTYMFQCFSYFKKQHLTNVINFDKLGIKETTMADELMAKGYSASDAEKIISFFRARIQIIKTRESEKQTNNLASYSFSINKLGWHNVDCFPNKQNWEASDFLVLIKSQDTLDYISVSLVIPNYNTSIFSIYNNKEQYSFTKHEDGYKNLPVGEDAIIVAFSYKDSKPYFGKQKIKIPKDGQIELTLNRSTSQQIKKDIEKLTE